jgi:hypothetical protein
MRQRLRMIVDFDVLRNGLVRRPATLTCVNSMLLLRSSPPCPPHEFAATDERDARNRIRLASELQMAVPNQELLFHYQPQLDLSSGEWVGAEVLLRWNHGAFGPQPPCRPGQCLRSRRAEGRPASAKLARSDHGRQGAKPSEVLSMVVLVYLRFKWI